ncbi:hypothetical protein SacN8_08120 [Sulfolobus acidocaldarius N8]|uniref:Uncharacterized protein n=1 Tax=Sulfolobus acidocaldarius N8 TaxID=1028566 RepID=M1IWI7_9CREN|nr:hypothetical protein SacN8_08120 [Sulfolobus acidocaldarius N8]
MKNIRDNTDTATPAMVNTIMSRVKMFPKKDIRRK